MENVQDRLVRYLNDAWGAEKASVKALRDVADKVEDPEVQALAERHRTVAHEMEEALEARIRALGEEPSGAKGFGATLIGRIGDALHEAKDDFDEAAQALMKEFGAESSKIGMYCALEAFANRVGDAETAALARRHAQRARECVESAWRLLPSTAARAVEGTEGALAPRTGATATAAPRTPQTEDTVSGGPFAGGTGVPSSMPNDMGPLASARGALYNTQQVSVGRESGSARFSTERLAQGTLRDVMTPQVEVVPPDATLADAAQRMKSLDVGPLPVCDGDRIVGMVTDRDITIRGVAEGRDPKKTRVVDVMTTDIVWCYEDEPVARAAQLMEEKQIRRLPVMGRDNRLCGIVSLGDLATRPIVGKEQLSGEVLREVSEPSRPPGVEVR